MKITHHRISKTFAALAAAALAASATILPLTAHADGDTDRWAIADFYAGLNARQADPTPAPMPSPTRQMAYTKVHRSPAAHRHTVR